MKKITTIAFCIFIFNISFAQKENKNFNTDSIKEVLQGTWILEKTSNYIYYVYPFFSKQEGYKEFEDSVEFTFKSDTLITMHYLKNVRFINDTSYIEKYTFKVIDNEKIEVTTIRDKKKLQEKSLLFYHHNDYSKIILRSILQSKSPTEKSIMVSYYYRKKRVCRIRRIIKRKLVFKYLSQRVLGK